MREWKYSGPERETGYDPAWDLDDADEAESVSYEAWPCRVVIPRGECHVCGAETVGRVEKHEADCPLAPVMPWEAL